MSWASKLALSALASLAYGAFAPQPAFAQTLETHRIPAALALEAVAEVVAECARQGYTETAVLVDVDGVRQAVLRGDRAGAHTYSAVSQAAAQSGRSSPFRPGRWCRP